MSHKDCIEPDASGGGSPCFIQINQPTNDSTLLPIIPVAGQYGGTGGASVLINIVLTYANPAQAGQSSGLQSPSNPLNQTFTWTFNNATPTLPDQDGLLTAYLYDSTGTTLLAQSTTIEVTIVNLPVLLGPGVL
jgi:hypothetical protein